MRYGSCRGSGHHDPREKICRPAGSTRESGPRGDTLNTIKSWFLQPAVIRGLAAAGMDGRGHESTYLAVLWCLIIPKRYRPERGLRAASGKFLKCRIHGKDPRVRPAGQRKNTGGSKWTDPRHDPDLTGYDYLYPFCEI